MPCVGVVSALGIAKRMQVIRKRAPRVAEIRLQLDRATQCADSLLAMPHTTGSTAALFVALVVAVAGIVTAGLRRTGMFGLGVPISYTTNTAAGSSSVAQPATRQCRSTQSAWR